MKCIYVDVLIVLNIYVNFFLLRATSKLTHTPLKTSRCLISATVGSLFSLTIFLPDIYFIIPLLIKAIAAVIITALAFGIKDKRHTLKLVAYFYIVNFIFGGVIMLLYNIFEPKFMAMGNSYFYIDFSLLSLVVFTAAAYFAVTALRFFMDKGCDMKHRYKVVIRKGDNVSLIDAISDSGNSLVDSFSGKPVIICRRSDLYKIIDFSYDISFENAKEAYEKNSVRFIPYSTIGNFGMIPVFTPDEILICDEETGRKRSVDAMVGINEKDVPAIFNPKLLC